MQEIICENSENSFCKLLGQVLCTCELPSAFRASVQKFFLSQKDKDLANTFFLEFGRANLENQLGELEHYSCMFDQCIAEAIQNFREKSKVNLLLYSFIGVAVALVLI